MKASKQKTRELTRGQLDDRVRAAVKGGAVISALGVALKYDARRKLLRASRGGFVIPTAAEGVSATDNGNGTLTLAGKPLKRWGRRQGWVSDEATVYVGKTVRGQKATFAAAVKKSARSAAHYAKVKAAKAAEAVKAKAVKTVKAKSVKTEPVKAKGVKAKAVKGKTVKTKVVKAAKRTRRVKA